MSWAKLPSFWVKPVLADLTAPRSFLEAPLAPGAQTYPLASLGWRKDGSSSMAALMVLMSLAIRLNQSSLGREFASASERPKTVAVTYDELQRMTGFARAPISSGLRLLEDLGAIKRVKVGRASQYELVGVEQPGHWCQLPQSTLLRKDGTLATKGMERKRATLHALKVYVVLMALRSQHYNTAALSYTSITKWTGLRREEVGPAVQILIAWRLVDVSEDIDDRHTEASDRSKRYRILGLGAIRHASEMA